MALEFSYLGRNAILNNMFGAWTRLGGSDGSSVRTLSIAFFSGTRPTIAQLTTNNKLVWQSSLTGIAGATRLYPTGTGTTSWQVHTINNTLFYTNPLTSALTIDWTNNSFTTTPSSIASSMLFNPGTLTWFAVYGANGANVNNNFNDLNIWFTGTIGLTGSGADIEMNRVDIPSVGYPVELKRLSFKFPQPTGVDMIFHKDIYTTALCNIFSGTYGISHANAKVVYNGGVNNGYAQSSNVVQLYTGTRPATPNDAVPAGATLIASIPNVTALGGDAYYQAMTYVSTTSEISITRTGNFIASAVATGSPTWCRILSNSLNNSTTYAAIDCTAGLPGSGAAVIYNDPITVVGQQVNITSLKFAHTLPPE